MDFLSAKYRKELVKQDIINKASLFIDKSNNTIDMKGFFSQNPYYRNKIQYYFGNMPDFYEEIGAKQEFKYVKKLKEQSQKRKTLSLRDELALERLEQLRKEGLTLQEIGEKYNITKQSVNQLINMLDTTRI
jgi:transposase